MGTLPAFLFLAFGILLLPSIGLAGSVPDEEKATLSSYSMDFMDVSPDGRVVVGVQRSTGIVWYFDAWLSREDDEELAGSTDSECDAPIGVFVSKKGSSGYLVSVPCESSGSDDTSAQVYQFSISESGDSGSASLLEAGTVSGNSNTTGYELTAATMDADGEYLYLAARESTTSSATVYKLDATTASQTPSAITNAFTSTVDIVAMTPIANSEAVLGADEEGSVYVFSSSVSTPTTSDCADSAPIDLIALNSSYALLTTSSSSNVYVIQLSGSAVNDCSAEDWGLSTSPGSMTLVSRDGAGGTGTDYLYMRAGTSTGSDIAVFMSSAITSSPSGPSLESTITIPTGESPIQSDILATSEGSDGVSRVYLAHSQGVSILGSGPWLSFSTDTEPAVVSGDEQIVTVQLASDENVSTLWFGLETPYDSSVTSSLQLEALSASSSESRELDMSKLSALATGTNTVFIYTTDSDDNLGWVGFHLEYVEEPATPEGLELAFGDQKAYITLDKSEETIDDYEILIWPASFSAPEEGEDLPADWDSDQSFIVDDETYPSSFDSDGAWPMSLDYGSEEETTWSDDGTQLTYALSPLENGVTYYLCIRAVVSGVPGTWTDVASVTPEETCGATCLAGEAGGFCSYVPGLEGKDSRTWGAFVLLLSSWAFCFLRRRDRGDSRDETGSARG